MNADVDEDGGLPKFVFKARAKKNWSDEEEGEHTLRLVEDEIICVCELDTHWWGG